MTMLMISSTLCLIGSGALWWGTAAIDAPAGGMMIVASMALCATGVFLFGIIMGRVLGFAL